MHLHFEIYLQRFIQDTNKMDMKIEEVSLENVMHKLFDASSKMISLPSVYQDLNLLCIYFSQWMIFWLN